MNTTDQDKSKENEQTAAKQEQKKPNEQVGVYFSEKIRISNPQTGEVVLERRC